MRGPGGVSRFQYPGRARPHGRHTPPAALFFSGCRKSRKPASRGSVLPAVSVGKDDAGRGGGGDTGPAGLFRIPGVLVKSLHIGMGNDKLPRRFIRQMAVRNTIQYAGERVDQIDGALRII
jgi:hypothetical protein